MEKQGLLDRMSEVVHRRRVLGLTVAIVVASAVWAQPELGVWGSSSGRYGE
jgi:hypothetical protein